MNRILITGAAGFIGANLVRELLKTKNEIHVVIRDTTELWEFLNYSCCFDYSSNAQIKAYGDQIDSANKAISLIPEYASVSTQDEFVNHLSQRSELYLFQSISLIMNSILTKL